MFEEKNNPEKLEEPSSQDSTPRWIPLYERYREAVLNPSNSYISSEETKEQ